MGKNNKMRKNKEELKQEIERFSPNINFGLSKEQVELRKSEKLVNNTKQKTSKTYLKIFLDNIFTFFISYFRASKHS